MTEHLHVLIVDADRRSRETVKAVLVRMISGVEVEEVSTPEGLRRSLETHGSDLVISDTQLPGRPRSELLRDIRLRQPRIPAIVFTAATREEVVLEAVNAGFDDYVLKSGNCEPRLESAVRSALQRLEMTGRAAGTPAF